jgi:DNA-binding CsgD family transcriptional regulator
MSTRFDIISELIRAIGERDFPAIAAQSVCKFFSFDLATIVLHRRNATPTLLFDNFDSAAGRQGISNYISFTHQLNPMLKQGHCSGTVRASDYKSEKFGDYTSPYFQDSPDEELGFITVGWPSRLEEVGLYFDAWDGVLEFSIYRQRTRRPATREVLHQLDTLRGPIAAAFGQHNYLFEGVSRSPFAKVLTPRELQVADLLLMGCTSEAIALRLEISQHTVKDYRKQIFRKLQICSLAELFARCRTSGERFHN